MSPWRQIRDGVYLATLEPASVNVGLVVGDRGAVLIDAGSSPQQGRMVAESAAQIAGQPVSHVVITHDHWDHLFGLAGVLAAAPAATAIGHENLAISNDPQFSPKVQADLGFDLAEAVLPSERVSIVRAIDLGSGRRVEILHPGGGHTRGDLVVLVPDAQVVFLGDLIEQAGDPAFGADSVIRNWPTALDAVLTSAGHSDQVRYVPGHGEVVDADFVAEQRIAIATLWGLGDDLVRAGTSLPQALEQVDADPDQMPLSPETMRDVLPLLFAELDAAGIKPSRRLPLV